MNVILARASLDEVTELHAFAERNAEYHQPLCMLPITAAAWQWVITANEQCWFTVRGVNRDLAGVLCLLRWSGPPWNTAELGAAADKMAAGTGLMAAGLRRLIAWAFGDIGLTRIEALIAPGNVPSMRFVTAAGLRREGIARGSVVIDGTPRDMERWAIVTGDPAQTLPMRRPSSPIGRDC